MKGKKFYFINKTQGSARLSQSSGTQRSAIQSHVQNGLPRPRKSKTMPCKDVPIDRMDDRALYDPSIRTMTCKFDPFNSASVHIDHTIRGLLHYYIFYYHPTIWTYKPHSLHSEPYAFRDSVIRIVHTALEDALPMYCLLSAAAARLRYVDALHFPSSTNKEVYYMQQSLHLMQERVDLTEINDYDATIRLVSCIMFLGAAEAYRDDYPASRVHLTTATRLLEPYGGVLHLKDKNLQGQMLMTDLALSCIELTPCSYGCDYDPGPASVLALTDGELREDNDEPLGATLLARDTFMIPVVFRKLILQILDSFNTKTRLNLSSMSGARAFETTHWVQKRNMAIRNRLLAFQTSDEKVHALRMALIMWTLLSMNITGRVKTVKIMASKLKGIIEPISSNEWNHHQDVRFWILTIGCYCALDNSGTHAWFAEQMRKMIIQEGERMGIRRGDGLLQDLIKFQKGFLYHDQEQSHLEKFVGWVQWWDDVISS